LSDVYGASPLSAYEVGQLVTAAVVGTGSSGGKDGHVDLSLRASRGGSASEDASAPASAKEGEARQAEVSAVSELAPGQVVYGYVRNCSQKGCFVSLGRGVDARVLLSNLSDTFVPAPAAAYPAVRPSFALICAHLRSFACARACIAQNPYSHPLPPPFFFRARW
jgi:rRNA biogenesis protein RRP5